MAGRGQRARGLHRGAYGKTRQFIEDHPFVGEERRRTWPTAVTPSPRIPNHLDDRAVGIVARIESPAARGASSTMVDGEVEEVTSYPVGSARNRRPEAARRDAGPVHRHVPATPWTRSAGSPPAHPSELTDAQGRLTTVVDAARGTTTSRGQVNSIQSVPMRTSLPRPCAADARAARALHRLRPQTADHRDLADLRARPVGDFGLALGPFRATPPALEVVEQLLPPHGATILHHTRLVRPYVIPGGQTLDT